MNYIGYKLQFPYGVHFGKTSLVDSHYTVCADTIFSALCHEAAKMAEGKLELLVEKIKTNSIAISDALPMIGTTMYVPKPIGMAIRKSELDSVKRKAMNKLAYVPVDKLEMFLEGDLDIVAESEKLSALGTGTMRTLAHINGAEKTTPYHLATYSFHEGNGLYIILGYEDESDKALFDELIRAVSYVGIGGKRSSGLGRFNLEYIELEGELTNRLNKNGSAYMSLSVTLPRDEEITGAMEGASYELIKRSGFVAPSSDRTAVESMNVKKEDLYVFTAGSCFAARFEGDIYNVGSGQDIVYRYAKPMLMEVSL